MKLEEGIIYTDADGDIFIVTSINRINEVIHIYMLSDKFKETNWGLDYENEQSQFKTKKIGEMKLLKILFGLDTESQT